eukprot:g38567.t1
MSEYHLWDHWHSPSRLSTVHPVKVLAGLGLTLSLFLFATARLTAHHANVLQAQGLRAGERDLSFVPSNGAESMLARPGPLQLLSPAWLGGVQCVFMYGPERKDQTRCQTFTQGARALAGWLYGAREEGCEEAAGGTLAALTGLAGDVLKGRLYCWSPPEFASKLRQADEMTGFDPTQRAAQGVRRGVSAVVLADGDTRQAYFYHQSCEESCGAAVLAAAASGAGGRRGVLSAANATGAKNTPVPSGAKFVTSNAGVRMPKLIYGTAWKKEATTDLVVQAVLQGFRGIDTACQRRHYREDLVGEALKQLAEKGVSREDIYLQTKFSSPGAQDPETAPYDLNADRSVQVQQSFAMSLKQLGVNYLDSLVMHSPERTYKETLEVWREMEKLVHAGKVRQLGISHASAPLLAQLWKDAEIKPAVVQNRFYGATGFDEDVLSLVKETNMYYQSFWSLTANPAVLNYPPYQELAKSRNQTPEQTFFKYLMQLADGHITPLTGTCSKLHMQQLRHRSGVFTQNSPPVACELLVSMSKHNHLWLAFAWHGQARARHESLGKEAHFVEMLEHRQTVFPLYSQRLGSHGVARSGCQADGRHHGAPQAQRGHVLSACCRPQCTDVMMTTSERASTRQWKLGSVWTPEAGKGAKTKRGRTTNPDQTGSYHESDQRQSGDQAASINSSAEGY